MPLDPNGAPAGYYYRAGATSYIQDPAGTYSSAGASAPTTDLAGTYSGPGASAPTTDPAGTYSGPGASAPTPDPLGTWSQAGASSPTPDDSTSGGYIVPFSAAPPEDAALDAILQTLVAGITGLPGNMVRPRWLPVATAQPEATADWCAIGVVEEQPESVGFSQHFANDVQGGLTLGTAPNGFTRTQNNAILVILASFYGPNARGYASLFRDGIWVPQNMEAPQILNIRLVDMPDPARFIPTIVNQITVRRVDVTFRLFAPYIRDWMIENILSVTGTIAADSGGEDIVPFNAP